EMLRVVVDGSPLAVDVAPAGLLPSELVTFLTESPHRAVCIADVPPSPASRSRYLVKKLRAALPELAIVVGRWGPAGLRDESSQSLVEAGADAVTTTLIETRERLLEIASAATGPDEASPAPAPRRARKRADRSSGAA